MQARLRRVLRLLAVGVGTLALWVAFSGRGRLWPSTISPAPSVSPFAVERNSGAATDSGTLNLATLERARASTSSTEWNWRQSIGAFQGLPPPPKVPIYPAEAYTKDAPAEVWWPNLAHDDVALRRLRKRFVGKTIYGYGGIAISCIPAWTRFYTPATGLRVRSIEREYGIVDWIAGGHGMGAPYLFGIAFLAYAPLVFVVDPPPVTAASEGANYGGEDGMPGPCPSLKLADFQVDTKLSLTPPPLRRGVVPIRVGMSRDQVIWAQGYPEELATKSAMLREDVWRYGGAMHQYTTVTFRHDRVVSISIPPMI